MDEVLEQLSLRNKSCAGVCLISMAEGSTTVCVCVWVSMCVCVCVCEVGWWSVCGCVGECVCV